MAKDMKVKDYVAQMQSGRSFVKAKMDSAGIGKVHLSFVEHSGRPKCEQVAAIEGYLNFEGAGSVSQLYYLVMSRDIRKKYANSVKTARETGSKYPNAIWDSNGGSSEKHDANGNVIKPCRYYAVQVSPGSKSDIVLQVMEGEGEVTETGGYMLKKGATVKRINVPLTFLDFCAFVVDIHDAVAAYKSVHAQLGYTGSEINEFTPYKPRNAVQQEPMNTTATTPQAMPQTSVPAPVATQQNAEKLSVVFVMYDSLGKTMQVTDSAQNVMTMFGKMRKALYKNTPEHYALVNDKYTLEAVQSALYSGAPTIPTCRFLSEKQDKECYVCVRRVEVTRYES